MIVLISMTIPTIFFLIYTYTFVNDYFYSNYVETTLSQSNRHLEDSIGTNLRMIENTYSRITSNQHIRENLYFRQHNEPSYYNEQLVKLNVETELKYVLGNDFAFNRNLIKSVVVFSDPENYYYLLSNYLPNQSLLDDAIRFYSSSPSSEDRIQYFSDYDTIYYMKSINDYVTNEELGKIVVGINYSVLKGEYASIDTTGGISSIFDQNNIYRYHTDPSLIGKDVDNKTLRHGTYSNTTNVTLGEAAYIVQAQHENYLNLTLLNYVQAQYFTKDFWSLFPNYLYFILLSVMISLFVGIYSVSHVTEPLKRITQTIENISDSDFKAKMPTYKYRELNDLSIVYNKMIDKIQYLFKEVYEKQLLVRESELKALHAQINPHFIFNVLETITWEARISENEKIEQMVTSLAQLLRSSLSFTNQEKYSIEQELEYVSFYLYLQTMRFEDRLSYEIKFDSDELLAYYLPKYSIQTLVENAIIHGIESKTDHSHISITVEKIENDLLIMVKDDGVGFDEDITDTIKDYDQRQPTQKHIGLKNVTQRIKLLYGEAYGITLTSQSGMGTTARIRIPKDEEN